MPLFLKWGRNSAKRGNAERYLTDWRSFGKSERMPWKEWVTRKLWETFAILSQKLLVWCLASSLFTLNMTLVDVLSKVCTLTKRQTVTLWQEGTIWTRSWRNNWQRTKLKKLPSRYSCRIRFAGIHAWLLIAETMIIEWCWLYRSCLKLRQKNQKRSSKKRSLLGTTNSSIAEGRNWDDSCLDLTVRVDASALSRRQVQVRARDFDSEVAPRHPNCHCFLAEIPKKSHPVRKFWEYYTSADYNIQSFLAVRWVVSSIHSWMTETFTPENSKQHKSQNRPRIVAETSFTDQSNVYSPVPEAAVIGFQAAVGQQPGTGWIAEWQRSTPRLGITFPSFRCCVEIGTKTTHRGVRSIMRTLRSEPGKDIPICRPCDLLLVLRPDGILGESTPAPKESRRCGGGDLENIRGPSTTAQASRRAGVLALGYCSFGPPSQCSGSGRGNARDIDHTCCLWMWTCAIRDFSGYFSHVRVSRPTAICAMLIRVIDYTFSWKVLHECHPVAAE